MTELEHAKRLVSALDSPDGNVIMSVFSGELDAAMRRLLLDSEGLERAQGAAQAFHKLMEKFVRARQIVESARRQQPEIL